MAYIGQAPANKPVSSSDLEDGLITNSKLAQDIISAETELATAPADTDELLISDAGVLKRIDASLVGGGGITVAHQWRVNTEFNGTATPIASNWEQADTDGYGGIGSVMSQSSGVFTFPETGIYLIDFRGGAKLDGSIRYFAMYIETTVNGSDFGPASYGYGQISQVQSGVNFGHTSTTFMFDVTNTSTHKVRFSFVPNSESATFLASTNQNNNSATFIRLGDT